MMYWKQFSFQESCSPYMDSLDLFNDYCMIMCFSIMIIITYMIFLSKISPTADYLSLGFNLLELVWAMIPVLVLVVIAIPSLWLLYLLDEDNNPLLTVKIMGNQWFWSYEYSDFNNLAFDSYMSTWSNPWSFRLLDVDNRLIIPWQTKIRLLISSSDVLHAWTVPSLGVKVDAVPGRLNQTFMFTDKIGLFFGQCSEICGVNHSFMPISLESQSVSSTLHWIMSKNSS